MAREKLGSFWIDTGTFLIGDPCQFIPIRGQSARLDYDGYMALWREQGETVPFLNDRERAAFEKMPQSAERDRVLSATRVIEPGHVLIEDRPGCAAGLAVRVGCDGWYAVYLERDAKGEPKRIVIELGGMVKP